MTIYSTVLFIHVVSAIGLFIALAAEGAILHSCISTPSHSCHSLFSRRSGWWHVLSVQVGQRYFLDSVGSGRDRTDHVDRRTRNGDTDCSPEEGGFKY